MLIRKEKYDTTHLAIWKIDESREELFSMLENKSFLQKDVLLVSSEAKQTEKLAVRVLLKELLGKEVNIKYEVSGRPYLSDKSFHLSISHTKGFVAVILDKDKTVGIDIEKISDKVVRVRDRFVSDQEFIDPDNELIHLLLHWSAKETMYKIIDREGVDLKSDLQIHHFKPQQKGTFEAGEIKQTFTINYEVTEDFVLTWSTVHI
ncbi:4'-phosphopantetheinyl transferase superfamily protein [Dysgonomonas sp. 520]|uniref:4'-phosphopantetheinyl transferase family protein n=1 Tax=Dysgonomonas sp. 520 TaxID=2302931 RepID=UPI0013D74140|nr:4'-phosphopantetheinyl transferase superfamily protein [Dysgonomonas sp. 520]NDW10748.1 hypothetical protein [Dysgonomonas sp. 520]